MKLQLVKRFATSAIVATALCTATFVATPAFGDDDHAKCQHRIEKAQVKLDQAIQRHGEHSPQAESRWRDLKAERERCWQAYHGWWDAHEHRWHDQHDWDDHH